MLTARAITLDIDWSPDFVIDAVAQILIEAAVPATWFVTHASPAVDRLRGYPHLFELGIHPNFFPNSTQGNTVEDVLAHCMNLVPDARSARTHGLYQNYMILDAIMNQTPIVADSSVFLFQAPSLQPTNYWRSGRALVRIPYFWEDDIEMGRPRPVWDFPAALLAGEGLKIFTFHPLHIYLNSSTLEAYAALKRNVPNIAESIPDDVEPLVHTGEGTQTFFRTLVKHFAQTGSGQKIIDIYRSIPPAQ